VELIVLLEIDDKQVNKEIYFLYNQRDGEGTGHVEICRPWKKTLDLTLDEMRSHYKFRQWSSLT